MADVVYLRSYDDRTREDDETARRVRDATVELLREVPYPSITMRSIANARAFLMAKSAHTSGLRKRSSPRSISNGCARRR